MVSYYRRKGVILTKICDEFLLVASEQAREECPYVKQINQTAAFLWEELTDRISFEQMMKSLKDRYEISDMSSAREQTKMFIDVMIKNGYIIAEEIAD